MDGTLNVERLTPLDLLMPRLYLKVFLTFRTTKSITKSTTTNTTIRILQHALDATARQIPWISGRVFPAISNTTAKPSLEIRWDVGCQAPVIVDKGSIAASYEVLAAKGMPPTAIPEDVWSVPAFVDDGLHAAGAPVFGASLFRFAGSEGVGICIGIHHNAVDARGLTELVRLWSANITGNALFNPVASRFDRQSEALSTELAAVSGQPLDNLFASHKEYSRETPSMPSSFPACTSRMFKVPITWINAARDAIRNHTSIRPTTNTVLCALLWSTITRIRVMHSTDRSSTEASRLAMAVNGRSRIDAGLSTPEAPYVGNVVLYSLAERSMEELAAPAQSPEQWLAETCNSIAESNSSSTINSRHVAEVYSLVESVDDYRKIFVGWDVFNGRDLIITSWADLELYDIDFGVGLGKPEFIRLPYTNADGVCVILPRKKSGSGDTTENSIEVVVSLRSEHMEVLERDNIWNSIVEQCSS